MCVSCNSGKGFCGNSADEESETKRKQALNRRERLIQGLPPCMKKMKKEKYLEECPSGT
jgi:hypothetical protein